MTRSAADIFHEAREMPAEKREGFLAGACGKDLALRNKVEALLKADAEAGAFMAAPTAGTTAKSDAAASREQAGAHIDRYKLLEQIGEGGMGTIWMAEQREPVKRRVALKIIKLGMDTKQVIARFEAERQALAMMDHPHIAKVLDAGATETGRPYFVMEYIRGVPILEYCDKERLDTRARLALFISVCQAIQHAHQKGIIHRDIKPSNVLVTLHDGVPVTKVIDFGIAKATNSELTTKTLFTEHRQLIGTPAYMSPEQAEMSSLDIDTRSDVYSLGVLLYELLTGTTPFDTRALLARSYDEMLRAIREDEPHKPSTRVSTLGATGTSTAQVRRAEQRNLSLLLRGDIDWIVMKCLEKDRTRRYETATGLAADIQRHLAGDAVLAAPPSASYRARKFVRRHRAQVAAAALVATALVLGLAGTVWQANNASAQATAATKAEAEARVARDAERNRYYELRAVADFQQKMLSDPLAEGYRLTEDVQRRFAAALETAKIPEAERTRLVDQFKRDWALVDATDTVRNLIDTTILKPAVKAVDEQFRDQPILDAQLRETLAWLHESMGLQDEAVSLQRNAFEDRRRSQGLEHPDTLTCRRYLAQLLSWHGKLAEAETLLAEQLATCERAFTAPNPQTAATLYVHASILLQLGRHDEAAVDALRAVEMYRGQPEWLVRAYDGSGFAGSRPRYGTNGVAGDAWLAAMTLASIRTAQGRTDEALAAEREAISYARRRMRAGSDDLAFQIATFAYHLLQRGTLETAREAEPLAREYLEISLKHGADDCRALYARSTLGHALVRIAELDPSLSPDVRGTRLRAAEPQLLDGYTGLLKAPFAPRIGEDARRDVLERVVHLYAVWNEVEPGQGFDAKAATWKSKPVRKEKP
jgi:eukaryotic-like serine/threonine-protein kinase